MVYTALQKVGESGVVKPDMRGKLSICPNERELEKEYVRQHITSFPKTESHYCRKETQRFYLNGDLSLNKMYTMYVQDRSQQNISPVSESTYKHIFYTEFNLGFFKRSKDRCDFCTAFHNSDNKDSLQQEFEIHHQMKNQVRCCKDNDKQRAKHDAEFASATFDLEDVLLTPKGHAKGFYHKRRLNTYNLSIHDYETGLGINNIWNERIGMRGSNEIGSCIYKYFQSQVKKGKRVFSLYSDACGGQNRNQHIVALLWWIRSKFDLKEIKHTFFVSGHSQNEVDGIHSRIEQTCKELDIYTTPQWAACIRSARQKPPRYEVNELDLEDIKDIKIISGQIKNVSVDTKRERIHYLKLKRIRIRSESPNIIDMSYDYGESEDSWFKIRLWAERKKEPGSTRR